MKYEFKHIRLSQGKKIFCDDYWDSFEKSKDGLSSKDKVYNSLTNHAIRDRNYEHVLNLWTAFRMKIMNYYDYDHHGLFLKVVLLLVGVFETIRKESINSFELDSGHYLSSPGYTCYVIKRFTCLYVIIISRTHFRVNQYSIVV